MKIKRKYLLVLLFFIPVYFILNLLVLDLFPFVHSDESWLAGLSRHMMNTGSLSVTEPFFDLFPRYPHAVKVLFHILQILFTYIFGYSAASVRMVSLIFGCASVVVFCLLVRRLVYTEWLPLAAALLLALDIQFLYAARFARQEIILILFFLLALFFFYTPVEKKRGKHDLLAGGMIALSTGFHPNAFVIFLPLLSLYLLRFFRKPEDDGRRKAVHLLLFLSPVVAGAVFFTGLSFIFDPLFPEHYYSYGKGFGVALPLIQKIGQIRGYYYKLFFRIGGTYYLPNIQGQLILFGISASAALIISIVRKTVRYKKSNPRTSLFIELLTILAALNAGIAAIGKYNQTSVIFIFPPALILIALILEEIGGQGKPGSKMLCLPLSLLLCAATAVSSAVQITPWLRSKNSYGRYITNVAEYVPPDVPVLANLNSDFYFNDGMLADFRNLPFLEKEGITFTRYIRNKGIRYIIYPDELDFIYDTRPVWNILYGNLWPFYDEMRDFIDSECEEVISFEAPVYGMRIVRYMNSKNWKVRVYRVINPFSSPEKE